MDNNTNSIRLKQDSRVLVINGEITDELCTQACIALLQLESSFLLFAAVSALGKTIDVVSIGRKFRKNLHYRYSKNDVHVIIRDEMQQPMAND